MPPYRHWLQSVSQGGSWHCHAGKALQVYSGNTRIAVGMLPGCNLLDVYSAAITVHRNPPATLLSMRE